LLFGFASLAAAAEPAAIVEKAIEAAGGKEKLSQAKAASWKFKGKLTLEGAENPFEGETTIAGLDQMRSEFKAEFGGMPIEVVTVVAGDKGWRKFGGAVMEIDPAGLANEKRMLQMQVAPALLVSLLSDPFKLAAAEEAKVDGVAADGVLVTGADGKTFTLYFSRDTGLPVKMVAKVLDFTGTEFEQETLFSDYADAGGVKKAKKLVARRDGQPFLAQEISDFKVMEKAPEGTFSQP
jgi:hypothetical protein